MTRRVWSFALLWVAAALPLAAQTGIEPNQQAPSGICGRTVFADVVALDQPYFWNRLGAVQPHGMVYALRRDVKAINSVSPGPGNARLRPEKRPRPIVLRVNEGDCLVVKFTNWLGFQPADNEQVRTREASVHITGMQLISTINDDGSWVGKNATSLASPGQTKTYRFFAQKEGVYMLHSTGALTTGEGDNGTISAGLWGAVNVEPRGSVWYRSQVTEADLAQTIVDSREIKRDDQGTSWLDLYPVIKYNMKHPPTHPTRPNLPVLEMLVYPAVSAGAPAGAHELIYTDLTAIIEQTQAPQFAPEVYPNRGEPFREFTIIFHDEPAAVQAFPLFYDNNGSVYNDARGLAYTLHSVRDAFGINYGTGGIGAEIIANRLGVGPMFDCEACKYEEFFLSSWAVGDPAMVVDVPANAPCDDDPMDNWQGGAAYETNTVSYYDERSEDENWTFPANPCVPTKGPKATVALYPDDPSNVYHSYLDDHVKFRNLLVGSDDHHIFHLHAHQWLHTQNEDNSSYKDSQAIGQGTGFTYEIAHEGSGNRNKTPGDSIFHCHFYPHFAQGMWGLWRVHDVLELGTPIGSDGRPKPETRALPDAEIAAGTPIPGLVPLPGQPMVPPPSVPVWIQGGQVKIALNQGQFAGNPGFPFYIPGLAGKRVPEPPLDVFVENGVPHDGGLPRYLILNAEIKEEKHTRLDFTKDIEKIDAVELAHEGEPWEQAAMRWHADLVTDSNDAVQNGFMSTFLPDGTPASGTAGHEVNGSKWIEGAPYADPCTRPAATGYPNAQFFRTYKAADIQMDVDFTSNGWHFPQQRFLSLWEDVDAYFNGTRQPQPLFIRANTYDCVTYLLTNLVPRYYEMDDFQVRTPTDVLGQHIHLVKFDVTSSDGAANGFNYEDGTLSYQEVQELIVGINQVEGIYDPKTGERHLLEPKAHPRFPGFPGARTTVQRWYVDDVLNNYNSNRSLRTVFTHDHFGPSTHQQAGLYAGLLTYKGTSANTTWRDAATGQLLGGRSDGGPTTWNAVIRGPDAFREFALEFGDFQLAYWPNDVYPDPDNAINPPGREQQWDQLATKPWIYEKPAIVGECPNGAPPPCPEAISADDPGFGVINYRSEPIALRILDNPKNSPTLASAPRGDLSYAFSSTVHGDPYTPLLKAYEQDDVRMRILVGAHEEEHNFSIHGNRWKFEPDSVNSGYKSSQMMGISEYYDIQLGHFLGEPNPDTGFVDYLYKAGSSNDDLWNGIWGLIRVYDDPRGDVVPIDPLRPVRANDVNLEVNTNAPTPTLPSLSNDPVPTTQASGSGPVSTAAAGTAPPIPHASVCPSNSLPARFYDLVAVSAAQALPGGQLVYNKRGAQLQTCTHNNAPYGQLDTSSCSPSGILGKLVDPTALMFVRQSDLDANDKLKPGAPTEPLILRARAGECIEIRLRNALPQGTYAADRDGFSLLPNIIDKFNQNQVPPSAKVGLHPTLLSYDGLFGDGVTVGFNPDQNVAPGQMRKYVWYAGSVDVDSSGNVIGTPIEFGAVPIYSTDPIKHTNKGLVGAIIIEPVNSTWQEYPGSRARALVDPTPYQPTNGDTFREFVLVTQDDVNLYMGSTQDTNPVPMRPLSVNEDPTETGQVAFNYRTEPVWYRKSFLPETPPTVTRNFQVANAFSNSAVGGAEPETPIFRALKGENVRFRLVHPGGDTQQHTWGVHGHLFQEQPWTNSSTRQGNNPTSEWKGVEYGHGPTNAFNALLENGAGGAFQVKGDFMYRDYVPWYLSNGLWGIFRVLGTRAEMEQQEPGWFTGVVEPAPEPTPVPVPPPGPEPPVLSESSVAEPESVPTPGFDATQPRFEQVGLGAGE